MASTLEREFREAVAERGNRRHERIRRGYGRARLGAAAAEVQPERAREGGGAHDDRHLSPLSVRARGSGRVRTCVCACVRVAACVCACVHVCAVLSVRACRRPRAAAEERCQ